MDSFVSSSMLRSTVATVSSARTVRRLWGCELSIREIPTHLACAYLKGHLKERALDWFEVLGYRVVEDKATDYAHLKQALTEQFPMVRNRSELKTRFYASSQKHNQKPSDFVNRQENWRETRGNNRYSDNSRPQREFNRFEGQGVSHNRRFDSRRRGGQSDHRFHNQGGRQGGSRNGVFRGQNDQNRSGRITDSDPKFQKTWEFPILNNIQYQCILGIGFMKESKLTLDFDKKSLIIPDDHEIHTGDQGPKVSRLYRYDRVKQGIIDYTIEKMLQEGTNRPIQSPYASPMVLTRKNNGLPPDSPEAYRFAIDYRKLKAITKYTRYSLTGD
ncbi:uncharacterized protein TNCV_3692601 [Trichonephila clavipes]|nr:uncharacterized protein TNCV_3692601 [Trichonephila clavipes]